VGEVVKNSDAAEWSDSFDLVNRGIHTPVLVDPGALYSSAISTDYPAMLLIDRDLRVLERVDASQGDGHIRDAIGAAVGVKAPHLGHSVCP
jgi:hypothetical protein